jgi:prefoldin alpha subunit
LELIEVLYNEINILQSSINEHQSALDVLQYYKSAEDDRQDTLLPIGGGVYLPVVISKPENVIVNVGAGVFLEKSVDEAIDRVRQSMDNLRRAMDERLKTLQQLKNRYEELSTQIAELQFKLQAKGK